MISIKQRRNRLLVTMLASSLATAILLVGAFLIWMDRVYTEYSTLLRLSPYRVVIPADPGINGRLYTIGRDSTYLLILTSRHARHPEPYHIKLASREIGVPELYQYVPLPRGAVVDRHTLGGYPLDTVIAADWEVKNDWREVHIHIRGFRVQCEGDVAPGRPDNSIPEMIRLGYQKEIVLLRD